MLVVVIYSKQTAGKGGSFSEGDEDGLVNFSGGVNLYAYMEQYHTTEDDQCGDDQLGNIFGCFVHMFSISSAKVLQKNETAK
jgi:hypothetical protein